jgi:hypothetical protein
MADLASSSLSIDLSRIATICEEEWKAFLDDMEIDPIPQRQDLRGFFLNWVAVFVPEAFPSSLSSLMMTWLRNHQATDETVWGFAKPPLIGSALFALTEDQYWLRAQTDHFAYGGSALRSFLHQSLALVAPQMVFDSELVARLDYGMKIPYFMMDTPLVLYAVSKGDPEQKLADLRKWKASYFMNSAESETVDCFLKGLPAQNPLQHWLLEKSSYVLLRLGCHLTGPPADAILPLGIALFEIWERVRQHPLVSPCIELKRPPKGN